MQAITVIAIAGFLIAGSLALAPRRVGVDGFFDGRDQDHLAPGLWTLVLSQVTTWIFARSLMNAAVLGYFYGFAGTLAYTAYYGSFLTGGFIVARLRATGARSVQDWLKQQFGALGTGCYNAVIGLRLLSEVFANLLVVGLIFAAVLPDVAGVSTISILTVSVVALAYSALGGLRASLRTDVLQMSVFLVVFGAALMALLGSSGFDFGEILRAQGTAGSTNGWILLLVAFLQVFSYPAHDPVMMDRGFLADSKTTKRSFIYAFFLSVVCIFGFGMFGIQAGLIGAEYQGELIGTWAGMFPPWVFAALMISLLVSALSTLDSALSSAARLCIDELRLLPRSVGNGRIIMVGFVVLGVLLTLWGNKSLFDAVAVSGTASMFLTPVLLVALVWGRVVPRWSYVVAFAASMLGALAYFLRDVPLVAAMLPEGHKYEQLLVICIVVLTVGFAAVLFGSYRAARLVEIEQG